MKNLIIFLSAFAFSLHLSAQEVCHTKNISFQSGEYAEYEIYYNWGFIWVNAGSVYFKIKQENYLGEKRYKLYSNGNTYRQYDWIYEVRDTYEAYIDTSTLKPYWFKRNISEGGDKIFETIEFDREKNKAYTYLKKGEEGEDDFKEYYDTAAIKPCSYDVLSMIYNARSINFKSHQKGDTIPISFFLEAKEYNSYIVYLGKANVKTKDKDHYSCYKFKALLIDGTLFKGGEEMIIWVTDDMNRLPVYIETPIHVGSIKAILSKTKGLRHPLTSLYKTNED